jgi:ribA/ribD-fused uncharacterized protein
MAKLIDSFRGDYYFLSNFYPATVQYDGITYQNNEAAFQAQKCLTITEQLKFADMDASSAKRLGRKVMLRPDWEQVKVRLMKEIVRMKFVQNPDLKEKLLATGDATLIEGNTWGDRTWGKVDGVGMNLLGKILMEVREELTNTVYDIDQSSMYKSVMRTTTL